MPRGGTLVVAYPHEPPTLNPYARGGDARATRDMARPLFPSLYRLEPAGARSPSALASEPVVDAGPPFTVTVTLRADLRWSDGSPVTASDLRFTWRALVDRRNPVVSRDGYDQIGDVAVQSPTRARIVFARPFARWRDLFWAILPERAFGRTAFAKAYVSNAPLSGGPFALASWTPGLQMVYARNAAATPPPPLDKIVVQFVPSFQTALSLLRRGKVDALGPYDAVDVARRATLGGGVTTTQDAGATWGGLWLNTRADVLGDVRVRRALALALDRRVLVDGLVRQEGSLQDSLVPSRTTRPFERYRHDLAAAKRLLDGAGWRGAPLRSRGGKDLTVDVAVIGSDELTVRLLRAMHVQARAAGIDLNAVELDAEELWPGWIYGSRLQAALLVARDPPFGSLRARFESSRRPPAGQNVSRLADRTLDRALQAADTEASENTLARAENLLAEFVPVIPLHRVAVTLAAGPKAGGLLANASADGFLWNAERWYRRAA